MDLEEQKRMSQNWRGRRYLACQAFDDIERVIENIGAEDGSQLPPTDRDVQPISDAMKRELQNSAVALLRMILTANDGGCSPQTLRRF